MTTSDFLTALRTHSALPLVFRLDGSAVAVPPGYHLTEVKRVAYETMDCGALLHRWHETQFELWSPAGREPGREDFMAAGKFLRIVDVVERSLPLNEGALARVFASLGGHPASLHDIAAVGVADGRLVVDLTADRTRCKAAERRAAAGGDDRASAGSCRSSSGAGAANESCAVPAGRSERAPVACCG